MDGEGKIVGMKEGDRGRKGRKSWERMIGK
jgi:hypothetical protein